MNITKKSALCICAALILSGCDSLMSESYSSEQSDEIVSSIANDIVSGIGNKLDDIGTNASLTYLGNNEVLKEYAESLKSDKISIEMKNSRFFKVLSYMIWNDFMYFESGKSFTEQYPEQSITYFAGKYSVKMDDMVQGVDSYMIFNSYDSTIYYVNNASKIYCTDKSSDSDTSLYDSLLKSGLDMLVYMAEIGEVTGSGKETVFGKEMEYEDINFGENTGRVYFENNYTMYALDTETGTYSKVIGVADAPISVPLDYKKVSMEKWAYVTAKDGSAE
ncbi:MAG: hypothetical protein J5997_06030 [Oscillospiraceae bacterium]|nr:hypothetical protein [Oscillospiraceae bacterium]